MKRLFRVRKHQEFDRIIKGGKKIKSPHFTLYFVPAEPTQNFTRIGLAVSKANGKAIKRTRIKRQVRAMLAKRNDYGDKIDLIIVIRPSYREEAFHENEAELNECLQQIKDKLH